MQEKICEWCKDGLCTVETPIEEQKVKEAPSSECDGSEEMQSRCGRLEADTEK